MVADEATLDVCNSEGWSVIFDKKPTKVLTILYSCLVDSSIVVHAFQCLDQKKGCGSSKHV